ncbi:MAG: type III-B CRISPR module RAMP protein Cmr4 [Planctomycetaceae bacterium]|nr:type III-B CRISPR module RAMP protein Cmr4 [Planctomycetaceae bacterium]
MSESLHLGALLGLHAQTSLHPGAGTALGVVDLPIQRERHTHWPMIAGSALKGVLRDAYRERLAALGDAALDDEPRWDDKLVSATDGGAGTLTKAKREGSKRKRADSTLKLNVLFGPPTDGASEFSGALAVTDARLLAFPVRSLKGVFAWATCPSALRRLARDASLTGLSGFPAQLADIPAKQFLCSDDCPCVMKSKDHEVLVLEELDFSQGVGNITAVANWLANHLLPSSPDYAATREQFLSHLVVLTDDDFTHFVRYSTEVTARIALDYDSKTVRDGALFYQEFLPPESILYSVVLLNPTRSLRKTTAETQALFADWSQAVNSLAYLQIGGDETTGKGLCAVRLQTSREAVQ